MTQVNPWILLSITISTEVVGTLSLRASDGFHRLVPSVVVVVAYIITFSLLAVILTKLPVATVYAVWSAVGIAAVAVLGTVLFKERLPPLAIGGILLIIVGVTLVQASGAERGS
jgi:small multidrug resistance pump